jgi:VanZ family protein
MRWELLVFIAGAIVIPLGCLLPKQWLPPLPNDKLLHFLAFGVMALLAGRLAATATQLSWAFLAIFVVGWAIEILQNWVPGRTFCWRDLAANTAGILAAAAFIPFFPGV